MAEVSTKKAPAKKVTKSGTKQDTKVAEKKNVKDPGIGHNQPPKEKKNNKAGDAAIAVRKAIKSIELLEADKRDIAADISEVYADAKHNDLDPKILRKLVAQRRMDAIDLAEMQETLDMYSHAAEGV